MTYSEFKLTYPKIDSSKVKLNFVSMYKHTMTYRGQFKYNQNIFDIVISIFAEYRADMYAEETLISLITENPDLDIEIIEN